MALKTREEYLSSLKTMRANVYKFGKKIEDVTTHPATRRVVESHARAFDAAHDPAREELFTTVSLLTGEKIMRNNSIMNSMDDVVSNMKMKRQCFRETGTCTGGLCVGWNAMNTMLAVTYEMDQALGTGYRQRLEQWIRYCQQECLVVAGALTDAKGDRSKAPSEQDNPDVTVRVKEIRDDGIVVRGMKAMIAGAVAANEIFVLPGSAYREADSAFAVSFVILRDAEGLTLVECRRPSDTREEETGFDIPVETGITQAYLLFDDVFVPNERVFMCGEHAYSGKVIRYFTANYRACIGGCVTGQGDVMLGAAVLMARANGLSMKKFSDKLVQMAVNNETTYGVGAGAIAMGRLHPGGVWLSDDLLAHVNKVHVATLPYETKRLLQDVCGGLVETGCFPSCADLFSEEYGEWLRTGLKAGSASVGARARAARLSEWLTIGAGVPGCMHGGGSPDGAKLVVRAGVPFEEYAGYARKLAGIEEEIREP